MPSRSRTAAASPSATKRGSDKTATRPTTIPAQPIAVVAPPQPTPTVTKPALMPAAKRARKAGAPASRIKPPAAKIETAEGRKAVPVEKATKPSPPAPETAKSAKTKLVRDSFTIPATEYAVLDALKQRALGSAHHAKKSEILRAGIKLLTALSDTDLLAALKGVPAIKTGRPKGKKGN
jgi:hypothetical protein